MTFATARARFESWSSLDAPHLPADPIDALQVQLARWQVRNFPDTGDVLIALGIGEECGELDEATTAADVINVIDALGDVAIYCSQLANANRLAIGPAIEYADTTRHRPACRTLLTAVGRLQHLVLKRAQRIREGMLPVEEYRAALHAAICAVLHEATMVARWTVDASTLAGPSFTVTAASVLARDWNANPHTGAAP